MLKQAQRSYPAEIDSLTSLRFFAAFYILIFHMQVFTAIKATGLAGALISQGGIAVDFFFVLSGFILAHVYLPAALNGKYRARDFIVKRFARIYPVHFVTLLFAAGVFALAQSIHYELEDNERSWLSFGINATLFQSWGFESYHSYNRPSWSISAEWFAYVAFAFALPFLAAYIKKKPLSNSIMILFWSLMLFFGMWSAALHLFARELTSLSFDGGMIRIIPEFCFGAALYFFGRSFDVKKPGVGIFVLILAAFFGLLALKVPDIFSVLMCGLIIFYVGELEKAGIRNVLNNRFLIYLGHISFSLYMVHWPLWLLSFMTIDLYAHAMLTHKIIIWPCLLILTHLLAAACYHIVETPSRRAITKAFVKV